MFLSPSDDNLPRYSSRTDEFRLWRCRMSPEDSVEIEIDDQVVDEHTVDEVLVEEVSIDGMCGVY